MYFYNKKPFYKKMRKVTEEIYSQIDNDLYNNEIDKWWQPNSALYLLKTTVNPLRVEYSLKVLFDTLKLNPVGKSAWLINGYSSNN